MFASVMSVTMCCFSVTGQLTVVYWAHCSWISLLLVIFTPFCYLPFPNCPHWLSTTIVWKLMGRTTD